MFVDIWSRLKGLANRLTEFRALGLHASQDSHRVEGYSVFGILGDHDENRSLNICQYYFGGS